MKELLANKILTALPEEDFARLLPRLEPVSLSSGENLYEPWGQIQFVYFPESAVLSHLHGFEDGSLTEAAMIGREGLAGLSSIFGSQAPAYWTQVVIHGSALRIRTEIVKEEFARGGAFHRHVLGYARLRMEQISQRAVCNGRHKINQRLCSWLLMVHDRVDDNQLPLTHELIAHHLGTRRAGITGIAQLLKNQGSIQYSRGLIRILDRRALESAACECYSVLSRSSIIFK